MHPHAPTHSVALPRRDEHLLLQRHPLIRSRDLDELRDVLARVYSGHELDVDQPRRSVDAVVNGAALEDIFVVYNSVGAPELRYRVDTRKAPPNQAIFLNLPQRGGGVLVHNGETVAFGADRGLCVDARRPFRGRYRGYAALNVVAPIQALTATARALLGDACPVTLDLRPSVDLSTSEGRALRRLVESLARSLNDHDGPLAMPLVAAQARSHLLTLVLATVPSNVQCLIRGQEKREPAVLPYHVKRARDFIHAQAHTRVDVATLCTAAGCSARALQAGFRRILAMSPMEYLEKTRLEGAHRELSSGAFEGTVGELALRWGFAHRGRFARAYIERFGRSPSELIRRRPGAREG